VTRRNSGAPNVADLQHCAILTRRAGRLNHRRRITKFAKLLHF